MPFLSIILSAVLCACAHAKNIEEDQVEIKTHKSISLSSIWATDMPGTIDVRELEPSKFGPTVRKLPQEKQTALLLDSLRHKVRLAVREVSRKRKAVGPGRVVNGTGREALAAALKSIKSEVQEEQTIKSGKVASFFVYGLEMGHYLHLNSVRREAHQFYVELVFVPHMTAELTQHYALIPIGRLPVGNYQVVMKCVSAKRAQTKSLANPDPKIMREKYVCKDFDFQVIE